MIKKNQEPTRQFSEIMRYHNSPEMKEKMKLKEKKEKRMEDVKKDYGL